MDIRTPELETERLQLRLFQKDDVEEVFARWESDPEVSRYMCWESHNDIKKTEEFLAYEASMVDSATWYRWCIEEKETKEMLGTCLIFFNDEDGYWDVSYNLAKAYWGKGYITEAMKAVLAFAETQLGIKEVVTTYAVENSASGRVLEKLGFRYEKDVPYECSGGKIQTTGRLCRWSADN